MIFHKQEIATVFCKHFTGETFLSFKEVGKESNKEISEAVGKAISQVQRLTDFYYHLGKKIQEKVLSDKNDKLPRKVCFALRCMYSNRKMSMLGQDFPAFFHLQ